MNKVTVACPICGEPMLLVDSAYFKSFMCATPKCIEAYEEMEEDITDLEAIQAVLDDVWGIEEGDNDGSDFLETGFSKYDNIGNIELEE